MKLITLIILNSKINVEYKNIYNNLLTFLNKFSYNNLSNLF